MRIQMTEISVFRVLLILKGLVNHQIESARIRVVLHEGKELPFVKGYYRLYGFPKIIQKTPCRFAI